MDIVMAGCSSGRAQMENAASDDAV